MDFLVLYNDPFVKIYYNIKWKRIYLTEEQNEKIYLLMVRNSFIKAWQRFENNNNNNTKLSKYEKLNGINQIKNKKPNK